MSCTAKLPFDLVLSPRKTIVPNGKKIGMKWIGKYLRARSVNQSDYYVHSVCVTIRHVLCLIRENLLGHLSQDRGLSLGRTVVGLNIIDAVERWLQSKIDRRRGRRSSSKITRNPSSTMATMAIVRHCYHHPHYGTLCFDVPIYFVPNRLQINSN